MDNTCGNRLLAVQETLILCGVAGLFGGNEVVFLANNLLGTMFSVGSMASMSFLYKIRRLKGVLLFALYLSAICRRSGPIE